MMTKCSCFLPWNNAVLRHLIKKTHTNNCVPQVFADDVDILNVHKEQVLLDGWTHNLSQHLIVPVTSGDHQDGHALFPQPRHWFLHLAGIHSIREPDQNPGQIWSGTSRHALFQNLVPSHQESVHRVGVALQLFSPLQGCLQTVLKAVGVKAELQMGFGPNLQQSHPHLVRPQRERQQELLEEVHHMEELVWGHATRGVQEEEDIALAAV